MVLTQSPSAAVRAPHRPFATGTRLMYKSHQSIARYFVDLDICTLKLPVKEGKYQLYELDSRTEENSRVQSSILCMLCRLRKREERIARLALLFCCHSHLSTLRLNGLWGKIVKKTRL